jgi:hypothetical protein
VSQRPGHLVSLLAEVGAIGELASQLPLRRLPVAGADDSTAHRRGPVVQRREQTPRLGEDPGVAERASHGDDLIEATTGNLA